jgi:hypothetical protein
MKTVSMTLAALGLALAMAAPLRAESLDGTQWKMHSKSTVKRVVNSMKFWRSNKLAFDAGQVTMGKGQPAAYSTGQDNGQTTWKMEKTTAKGVKVSMAGTVDGDKMTGTTTRIGTDGKTKTYEWKACKCAPKKAKSAPAKP